MSINWYPGHMARTKRIMAECLPQVDVVIELVDARIPRSSKNPDIAKMISDKPKIIILNKSDLSSPFQNKKWIDYYNSQGYTAILFDSKSAKKSTKELLIDNIRLILKDKLEKQSLKGITGKQIKTMIVGVPNVGKSTFINCISGSVRAKAEDRPGVTRVKQWIRIANGVDMLDMPGILWPKIDDGIAAERLAMTGAIKDLVLDTEELAMKMLTILRKNYSEQLCARYKLDKEFIPQDSYELLQLIGKKRGFIVSGGQIDTVRTSIILIDEFRAGKIGRITLDAI